MVSHQLKMIWNLLELIIELNGKKLSEKDIDAFKIMELEMNASWPIIQKKFKMLVKKF